MEVVKEVDLSNEQTREIQMLFARLTALKNLIKEFSPSDNAQSFDLLIEQLAQCQLDYDTWFEVMQKKHDLQTTPQNRWNVDFANKKLQLILN